MIILNINSLNTIDSLLNGSYSTNTSDDIADILSEDSNFQAALDSVTEKIDNATKKIVDVMSPEEIQQRDDDLRQASTELEAILLKMMYNEMYKTVPKDELFGDDNAMDIYRDMYNEEITKVAAQGGGIGLADYIYQHMKGYNH